jgi:hypothetical protein
MHSLNPVGLPPDSCRSVATNSSSSTGVENALCRAGEIQSTPIGIDDVLGIGSGHQAQRNSYSGEQLFHDISLVNNK